ncbi:hypothetical protein [Pseudomonas nunensis]|uniref:hypothetical protein n=1 Tax=Pseudomonas nunensis TaxID=2961896 RepID=UPI0006B60495|nr:hypothetical protein [Pseudomonas nunensis]KOY02738.1 hypothetical protein AM274_07915 [Pseudomonas nunensis]
MRPLLRHLCSSAVPRSVRNLLLGSLILQVTGCAMLSNHVTLKTEVPAQYAVDVTVSYRPLFTSVCILPDDYDGEPNPDKATFYSQLYPTPHTSEFEVELGKRVGDCTLVLYSFDFSIRDRSQTGRNTFDTSTVGLEVETFLKEDEQLATRLDEQLLEVRCHWEDADAMSHSERKLECHGLDANRQERKGWRLGMLKMRQLQGLTLRLKVSAADIAEKPQPLKSSIPTR